MNQSSRRDFIKKAGTLAAVGAGTTLGAASVQAKQSPTPANMPLTTAGRQIIPGSPYPTFSRAVRLDRLIFVAGVLGQKPGTRDLVSEEFEAQCRQALENLKASVEAGFNSRQSAQV